MIGFSAPVILNWISRKKNERMKETKEGMSVYLNISQYETIPDAWIFQNLLKIHWRLPEVVLHGLIGIRFIIIWKREHQTSKMWAQTDRFSHTNTFFPNIMNLNLLCQTRSSHVWPVGGSVTSHEPPTRLLLRNLNNACSMLRVALPLLERVDFLSHQMI